MAMLYDANGKKIESVRGPELSRALAQINELPKSFDEFWRAETTRQDEMMRVLRFRWANGIPTKFEGGKFLDSGIEWDGSKYATYGDLKKEAS